MTGERFSADEYVAACVTGTIQCVYPGDSPNAQDDGTKTYIDADGMWHGSSNITGYTLETGTYTNVSWKSTDGAGTYHHKGRLVITNIDNNRPNHS